MSTLSYATISGGHPSFKFFFPLSPVSDLGLRLGVSTWPWAVLWVERLVSYVEKLSA